jgi:hypothetical protein
MSRRRQNEMHHAIPHCPPSYDGTLAEFYREYAAHVLPAVGDVEHLRRLIVDECSKTDSRFVVRKVRDLERGREYQTASGVRFVPSDNAPAWWMHYVAFTRQRPTALDRMPTWMFEVARCIPTSVNTAGWHVAHIFNTNDRNTDWQNWSRAELTRRFIRNVHPCNCFYIPKPDWHRYGGDLQVIAFFATEYAKRYGAVWSEFLQLAGGVPLPAVDGKSTRYAYPLTQPAPSHSPYPSAAPSSSRVAASYRFSRLCFKAAVIEPLSWDDVFEVVTPVGTFRMSKADFYRDFPGVVQTRSYRESGIYHYPKVPAVALRYLVG